MPGPGCPSLHARSWPHTRPGTGAPRVPLPPPQVAPELPHYMLNRRKPSYHSTSVVGRLYDALDAHPVVAARQQQQGTPGGGAAAAAPSAAAGGAAPPLAALWPAPAAAAARAARYAASARAALGRFEGELLAVMNALKAHDLGERRGYHMRVHRCVYVCACVLARWLKELWATVPAAALACISSGLARI
jgi:hypothetical protein